MRLGMWGLVVRVRLREKEEGAWLCKFLYGWRLGIIGRLHA